MSDSPEKPVDEPAAVVPDDVTEVRPPAADLASGASPVLPAEPEGDAAIGGATPAPSAEEPVSAPAVSEPVSTPPAPGAAAPTWTPPAPPQDTSSSGASSSPAAVVQDRPEIAVAGAFAGGLVFALILKRLAR